jgi:hypothetical protein
MRRAGLCPAVSVVAGIGRFAEAEVLPVRLVVPIPCPEGEGASVLPY